MLIKFKVKFHPSIKFSNTCNDCIRLSFSYYNLNELLIGLNRLEEAYTIYQKFKVSLYGSNGKLGSLIKKEIEELDKEYIVRKQALQSKLNQFN